MERVELDGMRLLRQLLGSRQPVNSPSPTSRRLWEAGNPQVGPFLGLRVHGKLCV